MGGADAVIRRAREDFQKGEYRFVAEIANKLVFADPANEEARNLAADAYEQLGYLAESATWRSAYLFGAYELRHGTVRVGRGPALNPETVRSVPTEMLFDLLGVQLNGPRADGGAGRDAVGILCGGVSGRLMVSDQAARSIG
jgi:alkyl sulfatase BDS1-like metallo-beta-lactamase superfamily hydrolase